MFDYSILEKQVRKAFQNISPVWETTEYFSVFCAFFKAFRQARGEDHPFLRTDHVQRLMEKMPWLDEDHQLPVNAEEYPRLIEFYFQANFEGCDYRIGHFFSGHVRELRAIEAITR